jgi:hypothetical protein
MPIRMGMITDISELHDLARAVGSQFFFERRYADIEASLRCPDIFRYVGGPRGFVAFWQHRTRENPASPDFWLAWDYAFDVRNGKMHDHQERASSVLARESPLPQLELVASLPINPAYVSPSTIRLSPVPCTPPLVDIRFARPVRGDAYFHLLLGGPQVKREYFMLPQGKAAAQRVA